VKTAIQTIAVGFDGSPDAEAAVRWALKLAEQLGSQVVFVHAAGLLEHFDEPEIVSDLQETAWVLSGEAGLDASRGAGTSLTGIRAQSCCERPILPCPLTCWSSALAETGPTQGFSSAAPVTSWPNTPPSPW
jgi:hypothetical protein